MITLAELLHQYAGDLVAEYGQRLRPAHHRALWALQACHTAACGTLHYDCPGCQTPQDRYASCGHRFCPACQHHHNQQWLARQQLKLLPCDYYLVTFTLPAQLRGLCWAHQERVYTALFQAASETLQRFAHNDRALGGKLGMTAVLHTHSRQLAYHPHVHVVVPGGSLNGRVWKTINRRYLFNGKSLSQVFRAKFLAHLKAQDIRLPAGITPDWVVQCQAVGRGDKALTYLSRYLYRGVVNERNLLGLQDGQVRFRYQDNRTKRWRILTLPVLAFLWRVLKHVLPTGFRRTRDYGLLHGSARQARQHIQRQCRMPIPEENLPRIRRQAICPCCGQKMLLRWALFPKPRSLGLMPAT